MLDVHKWESTKSVLRDLPEDYLEGVAGRCTQEPRLDSRRKADRIRILLKGTAVVLLSTAAAGLALSQNVFSNSHLTHFNRDMEELNQFPGALHKLPGAFNPLKEESEAEETEDENTTLNQTVDTDRFPVYPYYPEQQNPTLPASNNQIDTPPAQYTPTPEPPSSDDSSNTADNNENTPLPSPDSSNPNPDSNDSTPESNGDDSGNSAPNPDDSDSPSTPPVPDNPTPDADGES